MAFNLEGLDKLDDYEKVKELVSRMQPAADSDVIDNLIDTEGKEYSDLIKIYTDKEFLYYHYDLYREDLAQKVKTIAGLYLLTHDEPDSEADKNRFNYMLAILTVIDSKAAEQVIEAVKKNHSDRRDYKSIDELKGKIYGSPENGQEMTDDRKVSDIPGDVNIAGDMEGKDSSNDSFLDECEKLYDIFNDDLNPLLRVNSKSWNRVTKALHAVKKLSAYKKSGILSDDLINAARKDLADAAEYYLKDHGLDAARKTDFGAKRMHSVMLALGCADKNAFKAFDKSVIMYYPVEESYNLLHEKSAEEFKNEYRKTLHHIDSSFNSASTKKWNSLFGDGLKKMEAGESNQDFREGYAQIVLAREAMKGNIAYNEKNLEEAKKKIAQGDEAIFVEKNFKNNKENYKLQYKDDTYKGVTESKKNYDKYFEKNKETLEILRKELKGTFADFTLIPYLMYYSIKEHADRGIELPPNGTLMLRPGNYKGVQFLNQLIHGMKNVPLKMCDELADLYGEVSSAVKEKGFNYSDATYAARRACRQRLNKLLKIDETTNLKLQDYYYEEVQKLNDQINMETKIEETDKGLKITDTSTRKAKGENINITVVVDKKVENGEKNYEEIDTSCDMPAELYNSIAKKSANIILAKYCLRNFVPCDPSSDTFNRISSQIAANNDLLIKGMIETFMSKKNYYCDDNKMEYNDYIDERVFLSRVEKGKEAVGLFNSIKGLLKENKLESLLKNKVKSQDTDIKARKTEAGMDSPRNSADAPEKSRSMSASF